MTMSRRIVERYKTSTTKEPLHVVKGDEGMEARVWLNADGERYNVTLFDTDSGETARGSHVFPSLPRAVAYAKTLVR